MKNILSTVKVYRDDLGDFIIPDDLYVRFTKKGLVDKRQKNENIEVFNNWLAKMKE